MTAASAMPNPRSHASPLPGRAARLRATRAELPGISPSAFTRRRNEILDYATAVFCDKGYEGASMRDLSRASGVSLAGLYHYFESKEKLLYSIQKHTFSTIVDNLRQRLGGVADPEARIRIFIQNHLEYFLANQKAMKVLSHEADVLKNGFGAEVAAIKREYYRICVGLIDDLKPGGLGGERNPEVSSRLAVLSLFGMMNWIYTWHNPRIDADAGQLARQMSDIFLRGVMKSPANHTSAGRIVLPGRSAARKGMKVSRKK